MDYRFSAIEMVLLVVGKEDIKISVHENVLFEASPVLKTIFTSKFNEGSERSIYLPDDDADLMDALIQNLYAPQSGFSDMRSTMELLRVYVLADKYNVVSVKNRVCERCLSTLETQPPTESEVEFVYENTTSKTAMRKLLVDWLAWAADPTWFSKESNCSWLLSVPQVAVDMCAALSNDCIKRSSAHPCLKHRSCYMEDEPDKDPEHTK